MPAVLPHALLALFDEARQAMEAGAFAKARAGLDRLLRMAPEFAPAHYFLGLCCSELDDPIGAERALRQAIALDGRQAAFPAALAKLLILTGRSADAVTLLEPWTTQKDVPAPLLEMQIRALVGSNRLNEALAASRRAEQCGIVDAALGSAQLLARLGRHHEAAASFRTALTRDAFDLRAHRGLAESVFAETRDVDASTALLDDALRRRWSRDLLLLKTQFLNRASRAIEALGLLEDGIARGPSDAVLHATAATAAALAGDIGRAREYARKACALAPGEPSFQILMAEICLGAGEAEQAFAITEALRRQAPFDQKLIALHALALRLLNDVRYRAFHDYDCFVRTYTIAPPPGWSRLEDFMAALADYFHRLHDGLGEPLAQSVRQGTQTDVNLADSTEPLIRDLFSALDAPVRDYIARLGHSGDPFAEPFRARNSGGHAWRGAWSVRLFPGGGHHVNHQHPEGWISSAFYIDVPETTQNAREGWIKFGEPGVPTTPKLDPEHYVKPEPGRLVLFPSYMWHGTVPFSGAARRLTFAFDIVPAHEA